MFVVKEIALLLLDVGVSLSSSRSLKCSPSSSSLTCSSSTFSCSGLMRDEFEVGTGVGGTFCETGDTGASICVSGAWVAGSSRV